MQLCPAWDKGDTLEGEVARGEEEDEEEGEVMYQGDTPSTSVWVWSWRVWRGIEE